MIRDPRGLARSNTGSTGYEHYLRHGHELFNRLSVLWDHSNAKTTAVKVKGKNLCFKHCIMTCSVDAKLRK
jgi:hypothetical protein